MSEIKRLLNALLWEIYGRIPSTFLRRHRKSELMMVHPKLYEPRLLARLSTEVIRDICDILQVEIRLMSKYLERVLITRDKNRTQQTILYGFLDVIVSSRLGESSREMRFTLSSPPGTAKGRGDSGRAVADEESTSPSDFSQWLHAMKMVARLPGGMPPEFRRKLWLALAEKYLKSKNVDWKKEEEKCFSEQWREDDEELGIQIVKDLHRTGSSLCSGPAGTINQAKLKRILLGYARYNPEVGYCQGFNMLGALILQVMDKEEIESIKVMIYLVEGILPRGYFSGSLGGLQADMAVFRELMTSKLPRLAKHLQKLQGPVENAFEPPLTNVFTMQWFLTMFCTCLPMTCVLRVWDLVLIEGSDVLLRTALVLWSLLEERILCAKTADDFYCKMGSFSSELLNGHLIDSNGLIEKVVELGPVPDLQKMRDKHLYNISPFRDKKGLQLYYSDEEGDSDEDSQMAVATAWGLRLSRRGSTGLSNRTEGKDRIALDISLLKKQYDRLRERQRQAHIILTSAVARQGSNPSPSSIQMNQLLIGRNAIVTNNGRRLGPPQGAIPPARKPSLPTNVKASKLVQSKPLRRGETLHWRDTELSKRRRGSVKWKDIKPGSQSQDDRASQLVDSAPSSRSSSSEPKSQRNSFKTHQRSDSSSYSEDSDGNSSTSTSLCDEDDHEIGDNTTSSLEASPMKKSKSSKKKLEGSHKKCLDDIFSGSEKQHSTRNDSQIPFVQLTTVGSPLLSANKTNVDSAKEDSETESNRLGYAGFVDEYSWPDISEPAKSSPLEDLKIDVTSHEADYLSLPTTITSISQLSPLPDISTYIKSSSISPLRTPISAFDYSNLVGSTDDPKDFDVIDEGVTNEYFERINIVERPTKLDLLYSLNEEDSIRNAFKSCDTSPEERLASPSLKRANPENTELTTHPFTEEVDRKMKVLLEYSNQSSLSFIAEAKHEISSGLFKDKEFESGSLKVNAVPYAKAKEAPSDGITDLVFPLPKIDQVDSLARSKREVPEGKGSEIVTSQDQLKNVFAPSITASTSKYSSSDIAEEDVSAPKFDRKEFTAIAKSEPRQSLMEEESKKEDLVELDITTEPKTVQIPTTESLENRFKALELTFLDKKHSERPKSVDLDAHLNPNVKQDIPNLVDLHTEQPKTHISDSQADSQHLASDLRTFSDTQRDQCQNMDPVMPESSSTLIETLDKAINSVGLGDNADKIEDSTDFKPKFLIRTSSEVRKDFKETFESENNSTDVRSEHSAKTAKLDNSKEMCLDKSEILGDSDGGLGLENDSSHSKRNCLTLEDSKDKENSSDKVSVLSPDKYPLFGEDKEFPTAEKEDVSFVDVQTLQQKPISASVEIPDVDPSTNVSERKDSMTENTDSQAPKKGLTESNDTHSDAESTVSSLRLVSIPSGDVLEISQSLTSDPKEDADRKIEQTEIQRNDVKQIDETMSLIDNGDSLDVVPTLLETEPIYVFTKIEQEVSDPVTSLNDSNQKRKSRIPSTEDLETRFKALERQFSDKSISLQKDSKDPPESKLKSSPIKDGIKSTIEISITENPPLKDETETYPKSESQKKSIPTTAALEERFEQLERKLSEHSLSAPNNVNQVEVSTKRKILPDNENQTPKSPTEMLAEPPYVRKRIPSTEDLENRFKALEIQKAIKSPTATNSGLLSPLSMSTSLPFSKPSADDNAKVPSTEALESRFKALEASKDDTVSVNGIPSTRDLENRFDALAQQKKDNERKQKLRETKNQELGCDLRPKSCSELEEEVPGRQTEKPEKVVSSNFEVETKKLPSTLDLELRFDAFERAKQELQQGSSTNSEFKSSKDILNENKKQSKHIPSTQDLETRFKFLEASKPVDDNQIERTKTSEFAPKRPLSQQFEVGAISSLFETDLKPVDEPKTSNPRNLQIVEYKPNTLRIDQSPRKDDELTPTNPSDITISFKRKDLYKLESQSDETLTATDTTRTEFDTKVESRPTSCPEYNDTIDSNTVNTDRVLKIIEENSKILHRILKKTLADAGNIETKTQHKLIHHPGITDSLLALGNIFPRSDETIPPGGTKSHSSYRSCITLHSDDNISDRLASIKSTIKSIDTLCEEKSFRKDKCQRYIDSLFAHSKVATTVPLNPSIKVEDFEANVSQTRLSKRELKKDISPRRRRDEEREEYESRVRRDTMPNSLDPSRELSCSVASFDVDKEVDRINQEKTTERPLSPHYGRTTPVVYIPAKLEIRHTTVTSTFYDRYLTEKEIEKTFPKSKKSPVSPTITKSYLDISNYSSINLNDRNSKSAENSPSRRKDAADLFLYDKSPSAKKKPSLTTLGVAQNDLHIQSCDNILLRLQSSQTPRKDIEPSAVVYNPLQRKPPDLGISLGLYKDYGSDESTKS